MLAVATASTRSRPEWRTLYPFHPGAPSRIWKDPEDPALDGSLPEVTVR
jgi:hypothetical protein